MGDQPQLMGDQPLALPRTVVAADHVRRHAPGEGIRHQATDLLQASALAENVLSSGGHAAVRPELLRELVIITSSLAGRRWLRANAANPAVETFTSLNLASDPPTLSSLDQVLSALLWSRFRRAGSDAASRMSHRAASRIPRFGARRNRATA
jgi:hypothetical protein